MSKITVAEQGAAPAAPSAGKVVIYAKTDGRLYAKDDAGTEYVLGVTLPLGLADGGTGGTSADTALTALGFSAFIKTLINDADATAARTTLGALGEITSVELTDPDAISGQDEDATPDVDADYVLIFDASANALKKALLANIAPPGITQSATQNLTGTSVDFTGIPADVKRITLNFAGASLSGTAGFLVQLGTSGGVETTGYAGASAINGNGSSPVVVGSTIGFLMNNGNPVNVVHGRMILERLDEASDLWTATYTMAWSTSTNVGFGGGSKTLTGGTLDRIRFTTTNGTDTFDAGSASILYE